MFLLTLIFSHFQVILVKMLLRSITQKNCWDKSRYYLVIKLDNWQNKQGDRHFIEHLQDSQIKSFLRASSSPLRSSVTQGCHLAFWKDDCCLILVNFSFCPFKTFNYVCNLFFKIKAPPCFCNFFYKQQIRTLYKCGPIDKNISRTIFSFPLISSINS